jgi:Xaa-Pro aminopeptidase
MHRTERVERLLSRERLDGYLAWKPSELLATTGHYPHWGTSVALVLPNGSSIVFAPPAEPQDTVPADCERGTIPYGVSGEPWSDLATAVAKRLSSRSGRTARLGYDPGFAHSSVPRNAAEWPPIDGALFESLAVESTIELIDVRAGALILYERKSAEEITAIARANSVAESALETFRSVLKPGVSEAALSGEVESAVQRAMELPDVQYARGWAFVQSGFETAFTGTYNRSSGKVISEGELVTIELATCVDGFWSDLTRTDVAGSASEAQRDLYAAVSEAQRAAIGKVRPGVQCAELYGTAHEVLQRHRLADFFPHPLGHQTGFRYHDQGPALESGESRTLEEGMVITVEPGVYVDAQQRHSPCRGMGCRIEDNLAVTENGYQLLSRSSAILSNKT